MHHNVMVLVPRPPLFFVHQFVHADYNSQKWKSGTVYYIKLKKNFFKWGRPGKKRLMAISILVAFTIIAFCFHIAAF